MSTLQRVLVQGLDPYMAMCGIKVKAWDDCSYEVYLSPNDR